ncbi:dihydrofolate reductase family protein [Microbacterium sp. cf332]|uniref:dihydrofolate reductase family protein n=1 Tax=Microbacterium sp. cf332 TaxID=1761804 RepID=UPI00088ADBD8|nr:dihydrofolate reductase family protein [Microbacterium sp. cf332]SDQ15539.1 RibD C-terminal domain-containing protein [Microbacterium sp. cf332]
MRVTEMLPETGESADSATDAGRAWLTARYHRESDAYVRVNMVSTLTGSASGGDGTSDSISSPTDRTVLGIIRRDADVVVVGAESVRAEGYVVPRTAALAVVSRSGRLEGHRLDGADADRVVIVVPAGVAPAVPAGVGVVTAGAGPDLSPAEVLAALAERGWTRVVCEGGPSLAGQFVAAGVVDELCLTVAPRVGPVTHPVLPLTDEQPTTVTGALMDAAGFSYLRLRVDARATRR